MNLFYNVSLLVYYKCHQQPEFLLRFSIWSFSKISSFYCVCGPSTKSLLLNNNSIGRPRPCARRRLSRVMWWCAVVCLLPSLQPPSGVFGPGPVGHPQNRSIVEGQIERDSVECLEYDDEFCCSSDDDDRPLARWLHFGRRDAPQPPRHSVRDNDEQLLVEGTMPLYLKQ